MFYPLPFFAAQLVHRMERIDCASYKSGFFFCQTHTCRLSQANVLKIKLFCCDLEDIQCLLGKESTSSFISSERRVDFCCDTTIPVEIDVRLIHHLLLADYLCSMLRMIK